MKHFLKKNLYHFAPLLSRDNYQNKIVNSPILHLTKLKRNKVSKNGQKWSKNGQKIVIFESQIFRIFSSVETEKIVFCVVAFDPFEI